MDAIVIGGGIGGLATARGLAQHGWTVTVLERQARLQAVGAGISLWPNAMRALHWLGVGAAVEQRGCLVTGGGLRRWDGRFLTRVEAGTGNGPLIVHRAALHEILGGDLPAGVTVQTDTHVEDPTTLTADLIVGADGIGSTVRAHYAPAVEVKDSGQVAWRAVVRSPADKHAGGETLGRGGWRFGQMPTAPGLVYWYAAAPGPLRTGTPQDQLAELREVFEGWHDPIPALIAATPPEALLHHPLLELGAVPPMRFGSHVALVGDAAHAMTPNLGQGACQALEDAVTLTYLLSSTPDVGTALRLYDRDRRPRVTAISRQSRRVGQLVGASGRWSGAAARTLLRLTPGRVAAAAAAKVTGWSPPKLHHHAAPAAAKTTA